MSFGTVSLSIGGVSPFVVGVTGFCRNVLGHSYRWLQPDLIPLSPFLTCDLGVTLGGSGVLSDPGLVDEQFRKAWLPYFCTADRRSRIPLFSMQKLVAGCRHSLRLSSLRLFGQDLYVVVHRKKATAGSLDGGLAGVEGPSCLV